MYTMEINKSSIEKLLMTISNCLEERINNEDNGFRIP